MSGIYIQGAEMPKSCWVCELGGAEQMDNHTCPFYSMEYWEQENYQDKIADGCPLIPVPDHGRLIDANKLFKEMEREYWFDNADWDKAEDLVISAPTVIPAEEGQ